jgi:hypothetical protein
MVALVMVTWSACAARRQFTTSDGAAVRAVLTAQQAAWNRGDLVGYMAGYLKSPTLVFTSGSKIRRGWDQTLATYQDRYGSDPSTMGSLDFEILGVQPLGADGASGPPPAGK